MRLPAAAISPLHHTAGPAFRPDIDGLRAVAILLVMAYHFGIPGFGGGYVGVDVFFVLSGYLITRLLIQEIEKTGTINLLNFYLRRARRLLPALALVLFVTVVLGALIYAPLEQQHFADTAVSTAAYISNLSFARTSTDYFGTDSKINPFLHTWSLGVEEQFYLAWPIFIMLGIGILGKREGVICKRCMLAWMLAVAVLSFAISFYLTGVRQPWAFFLSPTRAWEFSVGGLALLLPGLDKSNWLPKKIQNLCARISLPTSGSLLGLSGLVGILLGGVLFNETTVFPGMAALLPALSTALVLMVGGMEDGGVVLKWLGFRPLQEIGRISYSWYLWHWPVLIFAEALFGQFSLAIRFVLLLFSLGIAWLANHFIENPIRYSHRLSLSPALSVVMAISITVFGIALSLGWRSFSRAWTALPQQAIYSQTISDIGTIYKMDCVQSIEGVEVKECLLGAEDAAYTVVLFGDSHAGHWASALETIFLAKNWRLIVITKLGCAAVDEPFFYEPIGRIYTECETWRTRALARIQELQPDLVLVSSRDRDFGSEQRRIGTQKVFTSLSNASTNVILIGDTLYPGFEVPACLARIAWRPQFLPRQRCSINARDSKLDETYALQAAIAGQFPNVSTIEMNKFICETGDCQLFRDEIVLYRDGSHLSVKFVQSLADELARQIALHIGDKRESLGY